MRAINDEEKNTFNLITESESPKLCLVSTELSDIETACISWCKKEEDGTYRIIPLAVIVNEEIFSLLKDPAQANAHESKGKE